MAYRDAVGENLLPDDLLDDVQGLTLSDAVRRGDLAQPPHPHPGGVPGNGDDAGSQLLGIFQRARHVAPPQGPYNPLGNGGPSAGPAGPLSPPPGMPLFGQQHQQQQPTVRPPLQPPPGFGFPHPPPPPSSSAAGPGGWHPQQQQQHQLPLAPGLQSAMSAHGGGASQMWAMPPQQDQPGSPWQPPLSQQGVVLPPRPPPLPSGLPSGPGALDQLAAAGRPGGTDGVGAALLQALRSQAGAPYQQLGPGGPRHAPPPSEHLLLLEQQQRQEQLHLLQQQQQQQHPGMQLPLQQQQQLLPGGALPPPSAPGGPLQAGPDTPPIIAQLMAQVQARAAAGLPLPTPEQLQAVLAQHGFVAGGGAGVGGAGLPPPPPPISRPPGSPLDFPPRSPLVGGRGQTPPMRMPTPPRDGGGPRVGHMLAGSPGSGPDRGFGGTPTRGGGGGGGGGRRFSAGSAPRIAGNVDELNAALLDIAGSLGPSPEERRRHAEAFDVVKGLLLRHFPEGRVHLFGSACNQLNICNNNDIDVCLELPALLAAAAAAAAAKKEKEREQNKSNGGEESGDEGRGGGAEGRGGGREGDTSDHDAKAAVILKLEEVLAESGVMTDLLALPKARVPVIKFTYAPTATRVDVTVNNMLATVNTQLLRAYAEVDPRLRQLVYVIKYWAKQRRVNDAYRGTLSSYAYVIMCVALLQQRSPAVLPCLQAMEPTFRATIDGWACDYYDRVDELQGFGAPNGESLAHLVAAFFSYWAHHHDYVNSVVSIRCGKALSKAEKEWTKRLGSERHLVGIEDPFELSHDLGRTIDRFTVTTLRREFERAADILAHEPRPLQLLFQRRE